MPECVQLRLRGRMQEKFIAKAVENGVVIGWIVRTAPGELRMDAGWRDAKELMKLAREYQMDMTVVNERGIPALMRKIRQRSGLPVGLALGMMALMLFTSRIWRVEALSLDDMTGPDKLRAIEQTAAGLGATPGKLRSSIDRDLLAIGIQTRWPELTHVGVRMNGVSLQVEVASEQAAPEVYEISGSRDLVALYDAVIVHVDALAGKAAVQAGDTVRRGQVLIRGEERTGDETMKGVRALGTVTGRMWTQAECSLPVFRTESRRTGKKNVSSAVRLGKWSLTLSGGQEYEKQEQLKEYLPIGGLYLPVCIERITRWETVEERVPENTGRLRAQGEAWALELAREKLPPEAEETAFWFDYSEENGSLSVRATIEAQMNIAAERSRLTDDMFE